MTRMQHPDWRSANRAYVSAKLEQLRYVLDRCVAGPPVPESQAAEQTQTARKKPRGPRRWNLPEPPALLELCDRYFLSGFERAVLLLCIGVELDPRFRVLCQKLGGASQPTLGMVLSVLPESDFAALSAGSTLRAARLVTLSPAEAVARSPLRVDERVLSHVLGAPFLDAKLQPLLRKVSPPRSLPPSQQALVRTLRTIIGSETRRGRDGAVLWLCGPDAAERRALAAAVCQRLELSLWALRASDVPADPAERAELISLWTREQQISATALLLICPEGTPPEALHGAAAFLEQVPGCVFVSSRELLRLGERRGVRIDVPRPTREEQIQIWTAALGARATPVKELLDQMVTQFRISTDGIGAASAHALARAATSAELPGALWDACCRQARPQLDELAQRVEPVATFADLVLPDAQLAMLRALIAHQRHQSTVYYRWGFAQKSTRGLGVSALFFGQSGTGKTLAAEVIANALKLDLYRIDLSQVVSKYIGETEKNLRRVFDAAEEGGAVLLFDEADALFGKRSEVKDSHDRFANMEVSYLLQRMENYYGVSLLTTNMRSALDSAFLRRLRFIVEFPFPDARHRSELWRRVFPPRTPTEGLDPDKLARLNLAGGHIRNIALGAAFLAAAEGRGQPVTMRHLLSAARSECIKLERPLTEAEIGGWV